MPIEMPTPTQENFHRYGHISDDQIARDIEDTQREIEHLHKMRDAETILAAHHLSSSEREMYLFKSSTRNGQINDREAFVSKLVELQRLRTV